MSPDAKDVDRGLRSRGTIDGMSTRLRSRWRLRAPDHLRLAAFGARLFGEVEERTLA